MRIPPRSCCGPWSGYGQVDRRDWTCLRRVSGNPSDGADPAAGSLQRSMRRTRIAPRLRHRHSVASAAPGVRSRPSTLAGVGGFSLPRPSQPALHERQDTHVSYRIGIIGGDGIGPEVVAEALKVRRRRRRRLRRRRRSTSAARATCATARCCPTQYLDAHPRPRRDPARRGRHPRRAAGRASSAACCCALRFELDLYVNLRPFAAGPSRAQRRRRHARRPREHRGHLRGRGRVPAQGHAARGRDPGLGEHPHGRRALRPLRVRPRAVAATRKHLTLVHKTNVLTFAGDLWQRTFDEVAAEYPDVDDRATTTSTPRASTSCRTRSATT